MTEYRQQTEADLSPDAMHQIREAMRIDVNAGSGQRAHWEIPVVAKVRT